MRSILCCFLAFGFLQAIAQPLDYAPLLALEGGLSTESRVYSFPSEQGLTILFLEGTQAQLFVMDEQLQVRQQITVADLPDPTYHTYLGATDQPDALHLCYLNQTEGEYFVLRLDKTAGESDWYNIDMGRLARRNVFWGTFTYEGVLHVLRMPRGSGSIRLCRFEGGRNFHTLEYQLSNPDFLRKADYQFFPVIPDSLPGLELTWQAAKMYQQGDFIYLSLDQPGKTSVVELDMNTGSLREFELKAPLTSLVREDMMAHKSNSLIFGKYLYQLAYGRDSLALQIFPLGETEAIQRFAFGTSDDIYIRQGDFFQSHPQEELRSLSPEANWFDSLAMMPYVALSAELLSDSLVELSLGGVFPQQQLSPTGLLLGEEISTSFFRSIFHQDNLMPVDAPGENFASFRFPPPAFWGKSMLHSFRWQGSTFVGYYDPVLGRYVIGK